MLKNQGYLRINLDAVKHNYNVLKSRGGPGVRTAGVVKANGYGLGAAEIGGALFEAGCRDFFVSSVEEGIVLRQALPTARIIVLNGFAASVGDLYADNAIIPALGSFLEIESYKKLGAKRGKKLDAYLSFNTR